MRTFLKAAFLMFVGISLIRVGFGERDVAANASQKPVEISLKDLIARGPEGNPHIILTNFALCENYVYRKKGSMWEAAWVPVVARDSLPEGQDRGGKPINIQALLFTINVRKAADVYRLFDRPKVHALMMNKMTSLGKEERELLEQSYPSTDFSKCLILQEDREPADEIEVSLMVGGGSILTLAGVGVLGHGYLRKRRERLSHGQQ